MLLTPMSSSVGEDEKVVFEVIVSLLRQKEKKGENIPDESG